MTKTTIRPVTSLMMLEHLASTHDSYRKLAIISAENLGWMPRNLSEAMRYLRNEAMETDSEQGVVEEVNFCLDMV
jgi:hypothetical protein